MANQRISYVPLDKMDARMQAEMERDALFLASRCPLWVISCRDS
jgi:hypothetical protein